MPIIKSKYFKEENEELIARIEKKEVAFNELQIETQGLIMKTCDNFRELLSHEQVEFINDISKLKEPPDSIETILKDFNPLNVLPDEVLKNEIGRYIKDKKDLDSFVRTGSRAHGLFQPERLAPWSAKLLEYIVTGKQDEAEQLLIKTKEALPKLLEQETKVTDYSGRTFKCTAYEYAYWAKDTHMCRMLERYMDKDTKAAMLERCAAIEANGLKYTQNGTEQCSKHFDLTPLKKALQDYVDGYDNWKRTNSWDAIKAAWMQVGMAQRDLPVHVINEYCRPDRSFDPKPAFNEDELPRIVTFLNYRTGDVELLFPLVVSGSSGLGVDFAIARGWRDVAVLAPGGGLTVAASWVDLAAVSHLDEVRTDDLTQSRKDLESIGPGHALGK